MRQDRLGIKSLGITIVTVGVVNLLRYYFGFTRALEVILGVIFISLGTELIIAKIYFGRRNVKIKNNFLSIVLIMLISFGSITGIIFKNVYEYNSIYDYIYTDKDIVSERIDGIPFKEDIEIQAKKGQLHIVTTEKENIEIEINNDKQKKEIKDIKNLIVKNKKKKIVIDLKKYDERYNWSDDVYYKVHIPKKYIELKVVSSDTDDHISNFKGNIVFKKNGGKLDVENIKGNIKIDGEFDYLLAKKINGNLNFSGNINDMDIYDISERIKGNVDFSNINIENTFDIKKGIELNNSGEEYSNLEISLPKSQTGEFDIETINGDINIETSDEYEELLNRIESEDTIKLKGEIGEAPKSKFNINAINTDVNLSIDYS